MVPATATYRFMQLRCTVRGMAKATAKTADPTTRVTRKTRATFLIKSEPSVYSFDQLVRDGSTTWDGVRNYEARNNLRAMKKGDLLLFYHSNEGKEIVGLARAAKTAFQDPKTDEDWSAVDVEPVKKLKVPVTLAQVKAHPLLSKMALVKKSRISVVPVTDEELAAVLALAQTKA
jgi:predicted RNA-binding protein with PUA-like domain